MASILRRFDIEHTFRLFKQTLGRTAPNGAPVVVTNGEESRPSGPLYPELLEVIGDRPVIVRSAATAFNAFLDPTFADAVEATGRRRLAAEFQMVPRFAGEPYRNS